MNYGFHRRLLFAAAILATTAAGHALFAASVHTIELEAFATPEAAEAAKGKFEGSFAPLWVQERSNSQGELSYGVFAGKFPAFPDAWAYSKSLPEGIAPSAKPVTIEEESSRRTASKSTVPNALPVQLPFMSEADFGSAAKTVSTTTEAAFSFEAAPAAPPSDVVLAKPVETMSRQELLQVGFDAPKNKEGVPALQRFIAQEPSAAEANNARIRLARRLLGRKDYAGARTLLDEVKTTGSAEEKAKADLVSAYTDLYDKDAVSLPSFQAIANNPNYPAAMRREARMRVAASRHAQRDYVTSWLAFRQIERDPSTAQSIEAKVQLAGLAFELAASAKGSWPEVRSLCDAVISSPAAPVQSKATAALMRLETYFQEHDYDGCLSAVNSFLQTFPETPKREVAMARLWKGIVEVRKGQDAEAKATLAGVSELQLASSDKFAGKEPRAIALSWLAWLAKKEGDSVELARIASVLAADFPEAPETNRARAYLDTVPVDHSTAAPLNR